MSDSKQKFIAKLRKELDSSFTEDEIKEFWDEVITVDYENDDSNIDYELDSELDESFKLIYENKLNNDELRSVKLYNVLDWGRVKQALGEFTTLPSESKIVLALGILKVLNTAFNVRIGQKESIIIKILLSNFGKPGRYKGQTKKEELLHQLNKYLVKESKSEINLNELESLLDKLKQLNTIKVDNQYVWLIERVTCGASFK